MRDITNPEAGGALAPRTEGFWSDAVTDDQLLIKIVGRRFGDRPTERIDELLAQKRKGAMSITRKLGIGPDDVVLDLGAGAGLIARFIAPHCRHVYCLDVSDRMREFARRRFIGDLPNVDYHVMEYGDLSAFRGKGVTRAFAMAVFIHFNIFDIAIYLKAVHDMLAPGGRFLFTFRDGDLVDPATDEKFLVELRRYAVTRESRYLITPQSGHLVRRLATSAGFIILSDQDQAARRALLCGKPA